MCTAHKSFKHLSFYRSVQADFVLVKRMVQHHLVQRKGVAFLGDQASHQRLEDVVIERECLEVILDDMEAYSLKKC